MWAFLSLIEKVGGIVFIVLDMFFVSSRQKRCTARCLLGTVAFHIAKAGIAAPNIMERSCALTTMAKLISQSFRLINQANERTTM